MYNFVLNEIMYIDCRISHVFVGFLKICLFRLIIIIIIPDIIIENIDQFEIQGTVL